MQKSPRDFEPADSWRDSMEVCAVCDRNLTHSMDSVIDQRGHHHETVLDMDKENKPVFCLSCWEVVRQNLREKHNKSIMEFV